VLSSPAGSRGQCTYAAWHAALSTLDDVRRAVLARQHSEPFIEIL